MENETNSTRAERLFAALDAPGSVAAVLPERAAVANRTVSEADSRLSDAIENQITIDEEARPYLTGERKTLAEAIARIMLETAARQGLNSEVRIAKLTPAYGVTKILEVRQALATHGKRAIQYHDELAEVIDPWAKSLTPAQETLLFDDIAMDIGWDIYASED